MVLSSRITSSAVTPTGETEIIAQRKLFNDTLREKGYYPGVRFPGDCYIFDMVLGIDPRLVSAMRPVTEFTYCVFVLDADSNKTARAVNVVDGDREYTTQETVQVTRKFTQQQRKLLKEWWPLMSDEAKGNW